MPNRAMPLFYLDLTNGSPWIDEEGYELPDLAAAIDEAQCAARDLIGANVREGRPLGLDRSFRIRDKTGSVVAWVRFSEVIPPEPHNAG